MKQDSHWFKMISSRSTCDEFVRDAHAKLSTDHLTCPSLPHAEELLDGLCHSYSLLGSKPAPIPDQSHSFTEGLLRHRIKSLEKENAKLKADLNLAESKLKTVDYWEREYQQMREVKITITDTDGTEAEQRDWHARHFSSSMTDPRSGLVGWVQYWAGGFRHRVFQLMHGVLRAFGIKKDFRAQLGSATAIETAIVDNLADGIGMLNSHKTTDAQTVELDALLAGCASSKQARHGRCA